MKCTYCGGTDFLEGPSGGLSVNVLCANSQCRHWFNSAIGEITEDLHRVEPTEDQRKLAQAASNKRAADLRENTRMEGAAAFLNGDPASSCIRNTNNNEAGFYQAAGDDIVRLTGWLDEAQRFIPRRAPP
jgi:hypothetical protein